MWGRSRHRQQPLKNKSDAIEYIIITKYTYMPYFCHISLVSFTLLTTWPVMPDGLTRPATGTKADSQLGLEHVYGTA